MSEDVAIFAGGTVTPPDPLHAPRLIYDAVREAKNLAERREARYFHGLRERLMHAIRERTVTTLFQPIFDLGSGRIHGFEALSRGPAGTEIESPDVMFELARELQLVWELEALCIANVLPLLDEVCGRGLLFFNLESQFIQQLHTRGTAILEPLLSCQGNVVIEVTERSAIRDYAGFRRTLHDLKKMGFKIAIDDCGSGYATLEAVAELHPDYLKVGHSLFDGVENDPVRRSIVELVARTAEIIHATDDRRGDRIRGPAAGVPRNRHSQGTGLLSETARPLGGDQDAGLSRKPAVNLPEHHSSDIRCSACAFQPAGDDRRAGSPSAVLRARTARRRSRGSRGRACRERRDWPCAATRTCRCRPSSAGCCWRWR